MLSRYEYIEILQKMISKNLPIKLQKIIRSDDQLFGELLSAVMEADWKQERNPIPNHIVGNWGYRQLGFKWKIGRYKREFIYHRKYKLYECSSFNVEDIKTRVDDTNLIYEDFCDILNKSKVLKPKEKSCLKNKIIELKPLSECSPDSKYSAKSRINKGLDKLPQEYHFLKIKKADKYS